MNLPEITWVEPQPVQPTEGVLQASGGRLLLAEALTRRGITTLEEARAFLNPQSYPPTPASKLPDLDRAVERLASAIQDHERIGVWGDFDVDGQTSTSILVSTLRALDADVIYHIPVRGKESHGITIPYLNDFLDQGVRLLLTCDTGITAHEAVSHAASRGVETIITDHHTLGDTLPEAYAVINPQRLPEGHPLRSLPGAGTAYKLAEALLERLEKPGFADELLDLVALGTVADLAELRGDARYLVQRGLERLRHTQRMGIQAILELAEVNAANLSEEHIGFVLAPRLNAVGRLDDANPMVQFLTTGDQAEARITAATLEALNGQRRLLCEQVFQGAQAQISTDRSLLESPILILAHPQWPAGVVGIVASRLAGLYLRPVILMQGGEGGTLRGSARSVEGFNITTAIAAQKSLLNGFGGHPMAAGLSLPWENLPEFRRAIARTAKRMTAEKPLVFELPIDAFVKLNDISIDMVETLDCMAPFGPANPAFTLACRNVQIIKDAPVGRGGEHIQIIIEDEEGVQRKVMWWQGAGSPRPEGRFDLAFHARASNYRGQVDVQLEWVHARAIQENVVEIQSRKSKRAVVDRRNEANPAAILAQYAERNGAQIWREGLDNRALPGCFRDALAPCDTLVIASPPPGREELRQALERTGAKEVVLLALPNPAYDLPAYIKTLTGLVKRILSTYDGHSSLHELAGLTAQREAVITLGLQWLEARGYFGYEALENGKFRVYLESSPDPSRIAKIEASLQYLIEETSAYRAYFLRTEAQTLLQEG